jgi:hypothetical protein
VLCAAAAVVTRLLCGPTVPSLLLCCLEQLSVLTHPANTHSLVSLTNYYSIGHGLSFSHAMLVHAMLGHAVTLLLRPT